MPTYSAALSLYQFSPNKDVTLILMYRVKISQHDYMETVKKRPRMRHARLYAVKERHSQRPSHPLQACGAVNAPRLVSHIKAPLRRYLVRVTGTDLSTSLSLPRWVYLADATSVRYNSLILCQIDPERGRLHNMVRKRSF